MSTIRMGHPYGETPPNIFTDFEWAREHEEDLIAQYGRCSLIVYQGEVLGSGETYQEALEAAEANTSTANGVITPIHVRMPMSRTAFTARRHDGKD